MIFKERALRRLAAVENIEKANALADRFLAGDGSIPPGTVQAVDKLCEKDPATGQFASARIAIRSSLRRNFG